MADEVQLPETIQQQGPIEADHDPIEDQDSTLGDEEESDTTSLKSWIKDYRIENGRRYHAFSDSPYWGANDEQAQEHLDLSHELYTKTFYGQLFLAPIPTDDPIKVLDIGTGTGIWAIDFADKYPLADVLGTDISPIQPRWTPPNCRWEIDDCEREWTFPDNHFDYIHIRTLYGSINDWPALYARCMQHLKPGGYIEQAEYSARMFSEDNTLLPDSAITKAGLLADEAYAKLNRPNGELQIIFSMYQRLQDAGFENVVEERFKWPLGTWPRDKMMKEIGMWARAQLDMGMENYSMRLLTGILGWTAEEVYVLCAETRQQLRDKNVHAIWPMRVVYGRKPASG